MRETEVRGDTDHKESMEEDRAQLTLAWSGDVPGLKAGGAEMMGCKWKSHI